MNKTNEQIAILNTMAKATLGVSKVHGIGVIALRDIKKGETIYADKMPNVFSIPFEDLDKLYPEVREMILDRWPSIVNGSDFIYPDARLVSFMNHSFEPNYDPETDTALKDIREDEEITENYCQMPNVEKVYPWLDCKNNLVLIGNYKSRIKRF